MSSIFSRIISGEIPCYKVAENERYLAFLDINPLTEGHTLVVPKKEEDYLFDLDSETYLGLMDFSKQVAIAIKNVVSCKRICVAVLGFEVPHAHLHLIPCKTEADANFRNPKLKLEKEKMVQIASGIYSEYNRLNTL